MRNSLAAVLPLKQHTSALGRQAILVDIENVVGGAVLTKAAADWARRQIEGVIGSRDDDHVTIAVSHIGFLDTALAWPNRRVVIRSGVDGADLALIEEIDALKVERYDEVVLVSGDGIFANHVARLVTRGARVTVVAHHGHCSARLRLAASRTVYFQPDGQSRFAGAA